jgi:hypothetical protein
LNKPPELRKIDMRSGAWIVRSLHGAGSFMKAVKEILKYKLDLEGVQEVEWDSSGTESAGKYILYGRGMRIMNLVQFFFCTYENHVSS